MIDALIAGRLYGTPQRRTSKNGNPFVTVKVRTPMASGESSFVNVIAFSESAMAALLALAEGDSAAIAGELKVSTYTDKDGVARPSLDLTAHAVLTEYHGAAQAQGCRGDALGCTSALRSWRGLIRLVPPLVAGVDMPEQTVQSPLLSPIS